MAEYVHLSSHWNHIIFTKLSKVYQAPMGIIGKIYANSMLVLINSQMVLGSEKTQTPCYGHLSTEI